MSFYIYKYVVNNKIVYIGQTTDLERRIKQHENDKLKGFQGQIYYFECNNKTAMDSWEYCLINKYHPIYNIALNNITTNINIEEPEWKLYANTQQTNPKIVNFLDYANTKKPLKSTISEETVIVRKKPKIRFTCQHCKIVFETTNWTLTKGRHHSAQCPCCPYSAWAK